MGLGWSVPTKKQSWGNWFYSSRVIGQVEQIVYVLDQVNDQVSLPGQVISQNSDLVPFYCSLQFTLNWSEWSRTAFYYSQSNVLSAVPMIGKIYTLGLPYCCLHARQRWRSLSAPAAHAVFSTHLLCPGGCYEMVHGWSNLRLWNSIFLETDDRIVVTSY